MKKYFSIILTALMVMTQSAFARPKAIDLSDHTAGNAAIRSTLIPGWGQSFNGQQAKSYVVAGGVLLSGLAAYYFYRESENTYEDYEKRGLVNDPLYSDYEEQADQATLYTGIAAAFWVYGIIDAYFTGKKKYEGEFGKQFSPPVGMACVSNGKEVRLVYRARF